MKRHPAPTAAIASLRALAAVLLFVSVAGCALGTSGNGHGPVDRSLIEQRVTTYFRKTAGLPKSAGFKLVQLDPAMPGWQRGRFDVSLAGRTQQVDFLVSDDARYLLRGEIADLTIDPVQQNLAKLTIEGHPIRGSANAPVTIIEFSDFQCQFCAQAARGISGSLLKAYPGQVRVVHKNLPLPQIHSWAESAAVAAECAFQQNNDAFWSVYDTFYEQQSKLTPANMKDTAARAVRRAGGDQAAFRRCYEARDGLAAVQRDVAEATALGVNSTPTFFVNGRKIAGVQPIEGFKAIIDEELNGP